MKAGWKTTEFWKSLISGVIGLCITLGWISPENADKLTTALMQIVGAIIMIAPMVAYIISRGIAKRGK